MFRQIMQTELLGLIKQPPQFGEQVHAVIFGNLSLKHRSATTVVVDVTTGIVVEDVVETVDVVVGKLLVVAENVMVDVRVLVIMVEVVVVVMVVVVVVVVVMVLVVVVVVIVEVAVVVVEAEQQW